MKTFQVIRGGIVFELQPESEGGYTITVPSLPGCISYGETFEKAMEMIKDAMEGWLAVAREESVINLRTLKARLLEPSGNM